MSSCYALLLDFFNREIGLTAQLMLCCHALAVMLRALQVVVALCLDFFNREIGLTAWLALCYLASAVRLRVLLVVITI